MNHQCSYTQIGGKSVCIRCLSERSKPRIEAFDAMIERRRKVEIATNLAQSRIPPEYLKYDFDSFNTEVSPQAERILLSMKAYANSFAQTRFKRRGFVFTGTPGTGKTRIACTMAHTIIDLGFRAMYVSMPSLTHEIRNSYKNSDVSDASDLVGILSSVDFLVIDEIDLHGNSAADYQFMYDLINSRYNKTGFPTLAISNRPLEFLKTDLDERITSRIIGNYDAIKFNWENLRK